MEAFDAWVRRNVRWVDIAIGAFSFLLLGMPTLITLAPIYSGTLGLDDPDAIVLTGALAAIGMPIAIAVRRRFPVASAVAIDALALISWLPMGGLYPVHLLIYASVYSTAVHGPRWARRCSLAAAVFGSGLVASASVWTDNGDFYVSTGSGIAEPYVLGGTAYYNLDDAAMIFVALATVAGVAYALGLLRSSTQDRWRALRDRAAQLELERDQQATIAAGAERARIAREMHDVVAHSLSVIIAQADGGRYAAQGDPSVATAVLGTIGTTAREALADTRRLLGVLREAPVEGRVATGEIETAPAPGAAMLPALVESVRESGLNVALVETGEPQPLPPTADLAVYRVCQEALTNVLKHAGPPQKVTATLALTWTPQRLRIEVEDDGRGAGATSDGAGHGHLGLRERVAMFGGKAQTGPRPGGGYRVRVSIPLNTERVSA